MNFDFERPRVDRINYRCFSICIMLRRLQSTSLISFYFISNFPLYLNSLASDQTACFLVAPFPDIRMFSTRYSVKSKVYTGYHATSEIEHGLSARTVDNPPSKARGISRYRRTTMLYFPLLALGYIVPI